MADKQKPSVSWLPTECEVEEIIIGLLNYYNTLGGENNIKYERKTDKSLSYWMSDRYRTPEEIYELIGPKLDKLEGSENKLARTFLADVILDAFGVISAREKIVLTGHWEKIARFMITYLYNNAFNYEDHYERNYVLQQSNFFRKKSSWMLNACNSDICPDHSMRLELFGLIWARNYWHELSTEKMVNFFVQTISELDCDVIYNKHDLCFSARDLWVCFVEFDFESQHNGEKPPLKELTDIGQRIAESLLDYKHCREVTFLQNILKLTGILAQIARFQFQSKSRHLRLRLNDCLTLIIHKFKTIFKDGMEKFAQICLHPFIYHYYIDLVDNITSSILDLSGKLNKWRKNKKLTKCRQDRLKRLVTRRNYMVYCMESIKAPINLPSVLLKQELGMPKLTGRAELQKKMLNRPNLQLSFNSSKDQIDFSKYNDQLIEDKLNLDDPNDDKDSDNDDYLSQNGYSLDDPNDLPLDLYIPLNPRALRSGMRPRTLILYFFA